MSAIRPKIFLKQGKELALKRLHPWVFSGAIARIDNDSLIDGSWVDVNDSKGNFIATGHYQQGSIAIRILSFENIEDAHSFYRHVISNALSYRVSLLKLQSLHTNAFRLIHGEGDGVPGLVIDIYNNVAVIEAHSWGVHHDRQIIQEILCELLPSTVVYYIPEHVGKTEDRGFMTTAISMPVSVTEYGMKFNVNCETGQKTGFFLDQRENRQILKQYAKGRHVLNAFCYSGGFSVYALSAEAASVDSVDVSKKAIQLTEENISLNFENDAPHQAYAEDVFKYLETTEKAYDLIILDPPAFAKHQNARHQAVKGYQRLNALALSKIKKGGVLFTFSCSQVVDKELFYNTIMSAAIMTKRNVRVLHHLSQGPDHPVSLFHPEGAYLKGLVLLVD